MNHQFSIGDTVRCTRTGLEAEVTGFHETNPDLVLCGWFDWQDDFQEVLFWNRELVLLKAAQKEEVKT